MNIKQPNNRVLVVLFMGVLMGALDIAIVGPALPSIQAYFRVDDRMIAWVFSIYVLFTLVGTPLIAKLSDLYGRRSIYVVDVALFASGSLLVAVAPSFSMLMVGRAIQGFAAGGIFPVASAVIGDIFPPEKRGAALGLIGAVFGVAFLLGPILGGVLLLIGWEWLFLINIPVAIVVIFLALRNLPQRRIAKVGRFDVLGMLVLGGSLACLALGINRIETGRFFASLGSIQVWPFLGVCILLGLAFPFIERRAESPVVRLDLFQNRQMVLSYLLSAGAGLGESSLVFVPALAVAALKVTSSSASFLLLPFVFALAISSPLVGRLLDRMGSRVVILIGTVLLTLGMLVLGFSSSQVGLFILAGILIALGLSALLGAPIRYIMLNEATPADRSAAQGVVALFSSVGQLLGGAMVGAVVASQGGGAHGYERAYVVAGGVSFFLVIAALGLKHREQEMATVQYNESKVQNVPSKEAVQ
ncbi:MAG: MFS transporter [Anaerolineaceae bacterium]|nr:MFS transporter [Anaerolineaceae bacterium]